MNDGGGEKPPVSDEEAAKAQYVALVRQDISMNLVALASSFGPVGLKEIPGSLVEFLVREQFMIIEQVLPSIEPEKAKEHQHIVIEVTRRGAPKPLQMRVVKRIELCKTLDEGLAWALLMAFLMYPAVRGILRLHGYNYEFKEARVSPILMPSN